MDLPAGRARVLAPVFDLLPLENAMPELLARHAASKQVLTLVETAVASPELAGLDATCSGLWLYVDDLARSHTISQNLSSRAGSAWHAIMHRREGDFANSHYWFRKAGTHPAFEGLNGYDPHDLVHAAEAASASSPPDLVDLQRREWCALFTWCAHKEQKHARDAAE